MSYILDALKRADTERERGNVPGVHTRQMATPSGHVVPSERSRLWLAVAAAVAIGAIGVGLWMWQSAAEAPLAVALKPVVVQPPVTTATAPPVAALAPATVKPAPKPTRAAPAVASPARSKPEVKPEPNIAVTAPAKTTPTLPAVPLLSELPEDLRRQVPALTVTGAVYSENPAQRLLLVNNLVLTQGALAAPELTLEEIRARSSVFSFRGTRFRVAH
ncbi:MAG: GspB domain-containing protein [Rhodoferax sp.]|uniref:general secretion pathway protein GspB n=1 Tax=Rhodoferax sp. TaxID=50421 RepID=UPI0014016F65|nr:general secretion pathway protein GspB [Rhodoferax sp.]NDP38384.1 GspB domain-containing protein [Rhodoferax sp.]